MSIKPYSSIIVLIIIFLIPFHVHSQDSEKTVTITCSGSGNTKDEAKQNALRSAIEQAFGTFISSKTEVLNDQIVSDQITSIANGNIKSYSIESEIQLPTQSWNVTVKSIVSINKLINFAESKGFNTELKGGLFVINIKQQMLNEAGEVKAVLNLLPVVHELMQNAFDFKITTSTPTVSPSNNDIWNIKLNIEGIANNNMIACSEYFLKTMQAISLKQDEVKEYLQLKKKIYVYVVKHNSEQYPIYLRNLQSVKLIENITELNTFYASNFTVKEKKSQQILDFLPPFENERYRWQRKYNPFPQDLKRGTVSEYSTFWFGRSGNLFGGYEGLDYYDSRWEKDIRHKTKDFGFLAEIDHYKDIQRHTIQFLNIGDAGCSISKIFQFKLNEIEKIEGFDVTSKGNALQFKRNGLLFKDAHNKEFVLSIIQPVRKAKNEDHNYNSDINDSLLVFNTFISANKLNEFKAKNILGENNWRLPTWEEGIVLFNFFYSYNFPFFWDLQSSKHRFVFNTLETDNTTIREMSDEDLLLKPNDRFEISLKSFIRKNIWKINYILVKSNE